MDEPQNKRGNPRETEIQEMEDRISELPDFIIHHILSFLKTRLYTPLQVELVRMSVLSKKWFHLTASYPILSFLYYRFASREDFFKYVEYTITRFCHQNLAAHKLNLVTNLWYPREVDIINECLELVFKNGVRDLFININNALHPPPPDVAVPMPLYRLPNTLLSATSVVLKSLSICGCGLPSSLMHDVVRFKSLSHLKLNKVPIDDEVITYFTTSCPLLQELEIDNCPGIKRFCVYGHQKLQGVSFNYYTPVESIHIEASNLSNFSVDDYGNRGTPRMDLVSCKKLTTVSYSGHPLTYDFLSNFPFIENLQLFTKGNNLKWSSHALRTLVLNIDCDLEDIEFSTPNLVLFIYAYCKNDNTSRHSYWLTIIDKRWPLLRDSTKVKGCMQFHSGRYIDTLWFQKLRRFLDKKNGLKVLNLYIDALYSKESKKLEKLKAIELPPYELDHLELQLDTDAELSAHIAFVDAVLLCCRPRSLTLRSYLPVTDFEEQFKVAKFTYEKLAEQEDQSHTKVQIMGPIFTEAQRHLRDLKSASVALHPEINSISFIKEQVVQEEARQWNSQRHTDLNRLQRLLESYRSG